MPRHKSASAPTYVPYNSCGSTRPFAHGKVRLYPWEVRVLHVTSIPTVKLPMGNHYGYIKKNKRISHDVSNHKSSSTNQVEERLILAGNIENEKN